MGQANPGPQGANGTQGPLGPQGIKGDKGDKGEKSDKGDKGDKGDQGNQGLLGNKGDKGDKGDTGDKGDKGLLGNKGDKGDQGPLGDRGDKGIQGVQGIPGTQGVGYNIDTQLNSITRSAGDWLRIYGTPTNGTALYNGLSLYDGGGLAVGKFQHVPQGQLHVEGVIRSAVGFGPYTVRFYNKNSCLDSGAFDKNGDFSCDTNNPNQQFSYNPITGHLRHLATNKCLDTIDKNKWAFNNCNNHQNQRFYMAQNGIKSTSTGECLNVGNTTHHWPCDTNDTNQQAVFDLI